MHWLSGPKETQLHFPSPSLSFLYHPAIKLHCTLSRSSLPSHLLVLHSWLLVLPLGPLSPLLFSHSSPNLSSHGPVQSAGHVQCIVSSPCSGLFQMPLALLSIIATIKSFSSSVPRSHHILLFTREMRQTLFLPTERQGNDSTQVQFVRQ